MLQKASSFLRQFLLFSALPAAWLLLVHPAHADVTLPLRQAAAQISRGTDVPIYLPDRLPMEQGYLDISTTANGYRVDFNYTPDCGGTACYFGSIQAERGGQLSPNPFRDYAPRDLGGIREAFELVQLSDGTPAQFINGCGAYCTAVLEWQSQGVLYQVTVKNGTREMLLAIANSAVEAGARTAQTSAHPAVQKLSQKD
ncbi:hypothetical protein IFO70_27150 [Phormidium tenue FACHB-886]|nr:hypothetical protein [Phormidium tenue FACHB-886]